MTIRLLECNSFKPEQKGKLMRFIIILIILNSLSLFAVELNVDSQGVYLKSEKCSDLITLNKEFTKINSIISPNITISESGCTEDKNGMQVVHIPVEISNLIRYTISHNLKESSVDSIIHSTLLASDKVVASNALKFIAQIHASEFCDQSSIGKFGGIKILSNTNNHSLNLGEWELKSKESYPYIQINKLSRKKQQNIKNKRYCHPIIAFEKSEAFISFYDAFIDLFKYKKRMHEREIRETGYPAFKKQSLKAINLSIKITQYLNDNLELPVKEKKALMLIRENLSFYPSALLESRIHATEPTRERPESSFFTVLRLRQVERISSKSLKHWDKKDKELDKIINIKTQDQNQLALNYLQYLSKRSALYFGLKKRAQEKYFYSKQFEKLYNSIKELPQTAWEYAFKKISSKELWQIVSTNPVHYKLTYDKYYYRVKSFIPYYNFISKRKKEMIKDTIEHLSTVQKNNCFHDFGKDRYLCDSDRLMFSLTDFWKTYLENSKIVEKITKEIPTKQKEQYLIKRGEYSIFDLLIIAIKDPNNQKSFVKDGGNEGLDPNQKDEDFFKELTQRALQLSQ